MSPDQFNDLIRLRGMDAYFRDIGLRLPQTEQTIIQRLSPLAEAGDRTAYRMLEAFCNELHPERLYFAASIGNHFAALYLGIYHAHGHWVFHQDAAVARHFLGFAAQSTNTSIRDYALQELSTLCCPMKPFELSTFELESYQGDEETVVVPARIRIIGMDAFRNHTQIRRVILPESVRAIRSEAFAGCTNLESINLPPNLQIIGDYAFADCEKLRDITLPDQLHTLGRGAFQGCKSLRLLSIPGSVHVVSETAFQNTGLVYVFFGDGVREVRSLAFDGCPLQNAQHSSSLSRIHWLAFPSKDLFTTHSPDSLSREDIPISDELQETVKFICRLSDKHLDLKRTLLSALWERCPSQVEFGVQCGDSFSALEALRRLSRGNPASCTDEQLKSLVSTALATTDPALREAVHREHLILSCTRNAPDQTFTRQGRTLVIHGGQTQIPAGAFRNDCTIQTLILPCTLRTIGDSAFEGCSALHTVHFPPRLRTIGKRAFSRCSALMDMILPESLMELGPQAFADCRSLAQLTIPGSVSVVPESAFENAGLTQLILGHGIRTVQKKAFKNCPLTVLSYPVTLQLAENDAFKGCRKITYFRIFGDYMPIREYWPTFKGSNSPYRINSVFIQYQENFDMNTRFRATDPVETTLLGNCPGLPSRLGDHGYPLNLEIGTTMPILI